MAPLLRRTSRPVYPEDLEEGLDRYSRAMQVRWGAIILDFVIDLGWHLMPLHIAALAWTSCWL
jgi:hypothetical protein